MRYLLVHSPLVGPATLRRLGAALRDRGYTAVGPDLRAALEAGPPYHDRLARAAAAGLDPANPAPVTLVAHSGAGALVPAVAAAVGADRVHGVVFVDAVLPAPGRSWTATAPDALVTRLRGLVAADGRLPAWDTWFPPGTLEELVPDAAALAVVRAELPRVPYAYLAEDAPDRPLPERYAYLRLSAAYDEAARTVREAGRPVATEDRHHLAPVTDPAAVANTVLALA